MAIYYNLCIDCGNDSELAAATANLFDEFTMNVGGLPAISCKAIIVDLRGIHFVDVQPRGMGHGTLPRSERRSDLIDSEIVNAVRLLLYEELKKRLGFRRAVFGEECCDQLLDKDLEDDQAIDYAHMISSTTIFPVDPDGWRVEAFASGYRIISPLAR